MAGIITRIYSGPDGESHFEDVKMAVEAKGIGRESETMKATGLIFMELDSDHLFTWHNAPRRQYIITLEGEGEIEIGDGTRRRFGPGDILLVEDITGRGHISRVLNNKPRKLLVVTID